MYKLNLLSFSLWQALPGVLSSTIDIGAEYEAFKKCYNKLVSVIKIQIGPFCDALFSHDIIDESVRDFVRTVGMPDPQKAEKLVDTACDKIKIDSQVLHVFVQVLEETSNHHLAVELKGIYEQICSSSEGTTQQLLDSTTSTEPGIMCPHCGNCSMEHFLSDCCRGKDPSPEPMFPRLNVSGLSEKDQTDLKYRLLEETENIKTNFAKFTLRIVESLEQNRVPLDKVKDCVLSLDAFTDNIGVKVLDEADRELISAATSYSGIFITLRKYISFFNYRIIRIIVEVYGCENDKQLMKEYLKELGNFCNRSVFEIPSDTFSSNARTEGLCKVFAIKCTDDTAKLSLKNVMALILTVCKVFKIRASALKLRTIKDGCVELVFNVSSPVAKHLFPLSDEQEKALGDARMRLIQVPSHSNEHDKVLC